jgi:hypothetical protein
MNEIASTSTAPNQKGANQEQQISSTPNELSDRELNKVIGAARDGPVTFTYTPPLALGPRIHGEKIG